ncbi:MAG: acyl-CoA dehydrogenase family protein [Rubrivivax sp.]
MKLPAEDRSAELRNRVRAFVDEHVLPEEAAMRRGEFAMDDVLRARLVHKARRAGVLTLQAGREWGGMELSHRERGAVFEAAGRSLLGPLAINCAAPDEGNMHMLELVASPPQKLAWLKPMVDGELRSSFLMTEPGGAGSDPGLLQTTARRDGDTYVISGRKWMISGADGAGLAIILAKVEGEGGGPTMFLTRMGTPGIRRVRQLRTNYHDTIGGHWVMDLEGVRVPADAVLGDVGSALRYAQLRLAPARLTHCMRWLGALQRAHDVACAYAVRRKAFGKPLVRHEGVGFMLADSEMDLYMARSLIDSCARTLDGGADGREETAMAKVLCSEAYNRIADRCVQVLGGAGVTSETVVDHIARAVRPFRIYDGASEVHRWSMARAIERRAPASAEVDAMARDNAIDWDLQA